MVCDNDDVDTGAYCMTPLCCVSQHLLGVDVGVLVVCDRCMHDVNVDSYFLWCTDPSYIHSSQSLQSGPRPAQFCAIARPIVLPPTILAVV